jgi:hypothetical protein
MISSQAQKAFGKLGAACSPRWPSARRVEAHARRQHQALLRAADRSRRHPIRRAGSRRSPGPRSCRPAAGAGWPAASIARRTAAMSEVTPVEVSLCTTQTALMLCAASRAGAFDQVGLHAAAPAQRQPVVAVPGKARNSGSRPSAAPSSPQRREVAGLVHQHRVAGLSVLASAASQATGARGRDR